MKSPIQITRRQCVALFTVTFAFAALTGINANAAGKTPSRVIPKAILGKYQPADNGAWTQGCPTSLQIHANSTKEVTVCKGHWSCQTLALGTTRESGPGGSKKQWKSRQRVTATSSRITHYHLYKSKCDTFPLVCLNRWTTRESWQLLGEGKQLLYSKTLDNSTVQPKLQCLYDRTE